MTTTPYASESFLHQLLGKALAARASDVHLKVGQPPGARVSGNMVYFRVDKIRPEDTEAAARAILGDRPLRDKLPTLHELGTTYSVHGLGRFRVHIYRQRGALAIVMRSIATTIPTLRDLGVPAAAQAMVEQDHGLILIAGGASSGRSSTLAAMVGHINAGFPKHVLTLEDPIEFLHEDNRASVSQREVGFDTPSFAVGLAAAMRQDPDVILASELRDVRTLELAVEAAELGRLVLASYPAPDVPCAVRKLLTSSPDLRDRIVDTLQGIVAQRLLPRQDGAGMVLAAEVLVVTASGREVIRRLPWGAPAQPAAPPEPSRAGRPSSPPPAPSAAPPLDGSAVLKDLMEKGATTYGMQTLEMHIRALAASDLLSKEILAML